MKRVGPKIVSVSSPRPLIVQVQSLTQNPSQSATAEPDSADDEENGEIPKGNNKKSKKYGLAIIQTLTLFTFRNVNR